MLTVFGFLGVTLVLVVVIAIVLGFLQDRLVSRILDTIDRKCSALSELYGTQKRALADMTDLQGKILDRLVEKVHSSEQPKVRSSEQLIAIRCSFCGGVTKLSAQYLSAALEGGLYCNSCQKTSRFTAGTVVGHADLTGIECRAQDQARSEERARTRQLVDEFGGSPKFVMEKLQDGSNLVKARADFVHFRLSELVHENRELRDRLSADATGKGR